MDVTPLISANSKVIQSYSTDGFKISGTLYDGSVIVSHDDVIPWDGHDFSKMIVMKDAFDVVLLGTGKTLVMLPASERAAIKAQGLHVECMDTGAACRTYNVLMAEGRRIICALRKIDS